MSFTIVLLQFVLLVLATCFLLCEDRNFPSDFCLMLWCCRLTQGNVIRGKRSCHLGVPRPENGSQVCSDPVYCWLDTCWSFKWVFQKVCLYLLITFSFLLFFSVQTLSCLCLNRATVELVKTGWLWGVDGSWTSKGTYCMLECLTQRRSGPA